MLTWKSSLVLAAAESLGIQPLDRAAASSTPPIRGRSAVVTGSHPRGVSPHPHPAAGPPQLGHVLTASAFSRDLLYHIFHLAQTYRTSVAKERSLDHVLKVGSRQGSAGCDTVASSPLLPASGFRLSSSILSRKI